MDITQFRLFCRTTVHLPERLRGLTDGRTRPRISVQAIFRALFYGGVFGLGSVLGIDQFLRTSAGRRLMQRTRPAGSDTTLSRSLAGMALAPLHRLLTAVDRLGRALGPGRCPVGGGRWRIGILDGTTWGSLQASCFAEIGPIGLIGGVERLPTQGQELPTSESLLRRLLRQEGPRWIDLLLLEGLYVAQGFLRGALNEGHLDVLIKTEEKGLAIIQDAMGLFRSPDAPRYGVEHRKGTDVQRMRTYEIWACEGFTLNGVAASWKVAWVRETEITTGTPHECWVLTTREALTADEMRELAHWRWDIENNGFTQLNALVHTKHRYARPPHAQEAMALILCVAGNLLQLFLNQVPPQTITTLFGTVKNTRRFLQQVLRASVMLLPAPDTS